MKRFGDKIRKLREDRKLTREDLCEDETVISTRQLARIESGISIPNLSRVLYIAERLDVTVGELTDGRSLELPKRYKELKYLILRTLTYADGERVILKEQQLEEISVQFYDNLPEDEKLVIDTLQAKYDVHFSDNISFGQAIIEDYFDQIGKKDRYQVNDLILIDLYFIDVLYKIRQKEKVDLEFCNRLLDKLIFQKDDLDLEVLFVLNNLLLNLCSLYMEMEDIQRLKTILKTCHHIMSKIQDFQKAPILHMINWKIQLLFLENRKQAGIYYEQAILFSQMMGDQHLEKKLHEEWLKDSAT